MIKLTTMIKFDMFFKKMGFIRVGILCKHIFCVFKNANVEMIQQQLHLEALTRNFIYCLVNVDPRLGAFVEKFKSLKKEVEADCPNPPSKNKTDNLEQLVGVPKLAVVDVNNLTVGSTKGRKSCVSRGKRNALKVLKGQEIHVHSCGGTDHNLRGHAPGRFEIKNEVCCIKKK
ncbi:hypothetical protein Tco_0480317 [Tanacetum coccineum]